MAQRPMQPESPAQKLLVGVGIALVSTAVIGTVSMFMLVREDNARHAEVLKRLEILLDRQEREIVATREEVRALQSEITTIKAKVN